MGHVSLRALDGSQTQQKRKRKKTIDEACIIQSTGQKLDPNFGSRGYYFAWTKLVSSGFVIHLFYANKCMGGPWLLCLSDYYRFWPVGFWPLTKNCIFINTFAFTRKAEFIMPLHLTPNQRMNNDGTSLCCHSHLVLNGCLVV